MISGKECIPNPNIDTYYCGKRPQKNEQAIQSTGGTNAQIPTGVAVFQRRRVWATVASALGGPGVINLVNVIHRKEAKGWQRWRAVCLCDEGSGYRSWWIGPGGGEGDASWVLGEQSVGSQFINPYCAGGARFLHPGS
jgi:hypothetical protein